MTTQPPTPGGKKAMDFAATRDWPGYFRVMHGKPARETLVKALEFHEKSGGVVEQKLAIDLGCGEGRDALELLRRGWTVRAVDSHAMGIDMLLLRVAEEERTRLRTFVSGFESEDWSQGMDGRIALVNASFSLPFCGPEEFDAVWKRIVDVIRGGGGRFAGQLFGDRDTWATLPDRTHHARAALDRLFDAFVLEELREEEKDDKDALGNPKHWHVFHIVARKR